jgi:small subunit ribosomal protein S6
MSVKIKTREREYEILYILKPHLSDEIYTKQVDNFKSIVENNKGSISFIKPLGIKTLATPIEKQGQGYYIQAQFIATPKTLTEIETKFAIEENIMRHLIVTLESIKGKPAPAKPTEEG